MHTRRFPVRSCGPVMATSWRSLRSAASTIDTNAERPDRAAAACCTRAAPQLPGTVLRQRNTPARAVDVATCRHVHIGAAFTFTTIRDDVRDDISTCQPAQRIAGGHGVQIAARDVPIRWQTSV